MERDTRHSYHISGSGGSWSAGPDFPNGDNAGDSFAALLPSGNVLVFGLTGSLYEIRRHEVHDDWIGVRSTAPPADRSSHDSRILGRPALHGSGPTASVVGTSVKTSPASVVRGRTYKVSGTQFNGLSQAISFGDEFQNATNYPLVRITNNASGHVFYARTARPQLDGRRHRFAGRFDALRHSGVMEKVQARCKWSLTASRRSR